MSSLRKLTDHGIYCSQILANPDAFSIEEKKAALKKNAVWLQELKNYQFALETMIEEGEIPKFHSPRP